MSITNITNEETRLIIALNVMTEALEKTTKERDAFRAYWREWLANNAPGGWIDNLRKERDALALDAERYQAIRRMAVELSLSNDTIAMLLKDQPELDGAMKL